MENNEIEFTKLQDFTLSQNSFNDEIANSIFSLSIDEVSSPLEYQDIGFYVFKLLSIKEKETRLLSEVVKDIKKYLAEEAAYVEFDDTVNFADEMLLNDYDLNEIMDSLSKAKITKSTPSDDLLNKINNAEFYVGDMKKVFNDDFIHVIPQFKPSYNVVLIPLDCIIKSIG